MKALLVLYSELIGEGKERFYDELERNLSVLNRVIGIDNIYLSVSSHFRDIFDKFPEVCLINNIRDSSVFGAYRGLRKLRGNDVLLIDGGIRLSKESLFNFFNRMHVTVGMVKERWSGIAFVKMRDIDYVIKSLERNFEKNIIDAFYTLRDTYSIATEFVQLKERLALPILNLKQA
ncbi:hypothetical protein [Hydrogenivirga sp.]